MYLYILELEENKYYIGTSNNINQRLKDHKMGNGSEWTKKYKFVKTIEIIENSDHFEELKYTLIYMEKYKIDNIDLLEEVVKDQKGIMMTMADENTSIRKIISELSEIINVYKNTPEYKKQPIISIAMNIKKTDEYKKKQIQDANDRNTMFVSMIAFR